MDNSKSIKLNLNVGDLIDVNGGTQHHSRHIILDYFFDEEYDDDVYLTYAIYVGCPLNIDTYSRLNGKWKMPLRAYLKRDKDNHVLVIETYDRSS